jgi:hypothetical protein
MSDKGFVQDGQGLGLDDSRHLGRVGGGQVAQRRFQHLQRVGLAGECRGGAHLIHTPIRMLAGRRFRGDTGA